MMRVKLSYTVDEDQVLPEAAKIIGLASDHMQHSIYLYSEIQRVLVNAPTADEPNPDPTDVPHALDMIEEFRQALLNVDTRLSEVVEIIEGYSSFVEEDPVLEDAPAVKRGKKK
jgi:hypothetical protein